MTGSSSGIGAATAERLATEGAVVASAGHCRERLDELADRIGRGGGVAYAIEADVTGKPHPDGSGRCCSACRSRLPAPRAAPDAPHQPRIALGKEDAVLPVSWRRWTPVIQRARR